MRSLLRLALAVFCALSGSASALSADLPDGTLLFLENCNSIVQLATHGDVAHVALVFHEDSSEWVYEATPGKVRRILLDDYFVELARLNKKRGDDDRIRVLALRPEPAYTTEEVAKMRTYLDAQLGRRYSVKNYVRGKPYDGIHCAELASSTLNQSGRYTYQDCHKINPQAFYMLSKTTHAAPQALAIPELEMQEPWFLRFQRRCLACFTWCRWSSREAWLFLW
jgi:hypothetical protein